MVDSEFLAELIVENSTAQHRNPNAVWFIAEILPWVREKVVVIGSKSLVCALWYYGRLWEEVSRMCERDPLLTESWEAVLDSVYDKAREKFFGDEPKPPRKAIVKVLKSILTNRGIVDENAEEIVKTMGVLSKHVGHFYPIYSQLNRACTAVHCDPHFELMMRYAEEFGGKAPLRQLYRKLARFPAGQELFELNFAEEPGTVVVRQLQQ
jgi:hypothetical protein